MAMSTSAEPGNIWNPILSILRKTIGIFCAACPIVIMMHRQIEQHTLLMNNSQKETAPYIILSPKLDHYLRVHLPAQDP